MTPNTFYFFQFKWSSILLSFKLSHGKQFYRLSFNFQFCVDSSFCIYKVTNMGEGPNVARYGVSHTLAGPNPLLWPGKKTTLTIGLHHARASPPDRLQSPPAHCSPARPSSSTATPTRPPPATVSALLATLTARRPASGDSTTGAHPLARLRQSTPTVRGPPASQPHCHNHGWS
jgi:hypothetical protein